MAALGDQTHTRKYGKRAMKKTTRVDLTPMVDLGFLLITFFVFTSTMAKPTVMKVEMPYNKTVPSDPVCSSCVLTVVLCKNNSIRYYEGAPDEAGIRITGYNGIRLIIQEKKKRLKLLRGSADQFVLIIKPTPESTFKNFVDITDEVTINNIKRYYIDELKITEAGIVMKQAN